jgi:hypothetical protein
MSHKVLISIFLVLLVQIAAGQVTKTLTNTPDWSDTTKQVIVNNRLRGNVFVNVDTTNTATSVSVTTTVTAADQTQANSVSVTTADSGSNYVLTVDSSMNAPVVAPSSQIQSSATKTIMSVSLIAILTSLFGIYISPKMSGSSRSIIVLALLAAFGISLSSSQADLSELRADVNIVLPFYSTPVSKNFSITVYQGRSECHTGYLSCTYNPSTYSPPGAQGLIGYWLAEQQIENGEVKTSWDDSTLCTKSTWPGCPTGILCTAAGIKKIAFFSDSFLETRYNYPTSSDFNDRGGFAISGDLVNFTKSESWSCAHPKQVTDYDSYVINPPQMNYFRFSLTNGKLSISNIAGSVPPPAGEITAWTVYRQVSQHEYYTKYFIALCQSCASIVGCGGTSPNCPCKCYSECLRLSGFGTACTAKRDASNGIEDLQLF